MVDPDPGYRPRRAADDPPPRGDGPVPNSPDDEDQPKPLYRDEPAPSAAGSGPLTGDETRVSRPVFKPRARRTPDDEDSTTLLPRTPSGRRTGRDHEEHLDDDQPRRLLGRRGRLALLAGALAAVIAVGIAIIYAVATVGDPTADPAASGPPSTSGGSTSTGSPAQVLGDEALLTPSSAGRIAAGPWTVALTQRPPASDAPTAACLGAEPLEGQPPAQQEVIRLLSSGGSGKPSVLHHAAVYATPEDAAQAYAVAAKALGSCSAAGAHIVDGSTVTGLGDQATGLIAQVVTGGTTQWHSIVLSRVGSAVNLLDGAQASKALGVRGVAAALGTVSEAQCQAAGQPCTTDPKVDRGPPPLGGDVPGFLATGDLPPVGQADEAWVATPAEPPSEDFLGSQCETVTWTRLGASNVNSRVYLVPSSTRFGLNDIVLTMKNEKAATDLVAKIKADLDSCEKRKLTATVSDPQEVRGVGASSAEVSGWTADIAQKSTEGTQRYRVGIVSSGSKVAYTFLNPLAGGYDVTDDEWDDIAVRAGQRMTQVP